MMTGGSGLMNAGLADPVEEVGASTGEADHLPGRRVLVAAVRAAWQLKPYAHSAEAGRVDDGRNSTPVF